MYGESDRLSEDKRVEIEALLEEERKRVRGLARTMQNATFAITIVKGTQDRSDSVVKEVTANRPPGYFDCRAGCSFCCKLRVAVPAPEVFSIARIVARFDPVRRAELDARLAAHADAVRGVEAADFESQCPLLDGGGLCSVYAVRPAACRGYMSRDVEACRDESVPAIPRDLELTLKATALQIGAKRGFSSRKQVFKSAELGQSVFAALNDDTLEKRWFDGQDVFAAFRAPDD